MLPVSSMLGPGMLLSVFELVLSQDFWDVEQGISRFVILEGPAGLSPSFTVSGSAGFSTVSLELEVDPYRRNEVLWPYSGPTECGLEGT